MNKLYLVMVGLPAHGKSTLARRIKLGLSQQGIRTEIFNNGNMRRRLYGKESGCAEFFDSSNTEAVARRVEIARLTMENARRWLSENGQCAIIDATHGTVEQRRRVLDTLNNAPVMFLECVNSDAELAELFLREKVKLNDFADMSANDARTSFLRRVEFYKSVYVPLADENCWMRVDVADSRILSEQPCSDIALYSAVRSIVLSCWVHNLYLVRHGETIFNNDGRIGGDPVLSETGRAQAELLAMHFRHTQLPYIFTSTKVRTAQMAEPLIKNHPDSTVMALEEFDEINAGLCEGMTYADIRRLMPHEYTARNNNKYNYIYPEGESYASMRKRVAYGLRKALFIAREDSLMIVGHQAVNRMILSLFLWQRQEDIPHLYIPQDQFYHITVTQRTKLFELIRFASV